MKLRTAFGEKLGSIALLAFLPASGQAQNLFQTTNLSSDLPGVAAHQDTQLVNPWGISYAPQGPFWVSDNATGVTTLYNSTGTKQGLVVSGLGAPTGQVFNGSSQFHGDLFLFDSEDGSITGWRPALGTTAETLLPASNANVYKGLAIQGGQIFATNFHTGNVDIFNGDFSSGGSFTDPNLPAGYAPFNVQSLGGKLYVTYALQDSAKEDDVAGLGNGFVDVFDPTTHTFTRLASQGTLDSPWGLALAPGTFGAFANDLLVGNFGDGHINAFDPNNGAFEGQLNDASGNPLTLPGLWDLIPGNGFAAGSPNSIYFTAGIGDPPNFTTGIEGHGLFGSLQAVPEPGPTATLFAGALTASGCSGAAANPWAGRERAAQ